MKNNTILSKAEKVQMLDVACRMVAIDGQYTTEEQQFINELIVITGLRASAYSSLEDYINLLIKGNEEWMTISESWAKSEYDVLMELQKEYSEAASWYKLGYAYKFGDSIYGNTIVMDPKRAKYCFDLAASKGYTKAGEEINNI